jgi:hypothetical protein
MSEKDLIAKLNNLKNISPDKTWLDNNRELLLSQISNSGAKELSAWENLFINLSSFTKAAAQPVYAFGIFVFALVATGIYSHQLFTSAKPNDTLYIARVISEKAKLSTIINPESRDKLAMQFANERAQEISAVLADPSFNNDQNKDDIAKLNISFNEEIETIKTKIKNLAPVKNNQEAKVAENNSLNNDSVLIAENNKDNKGVQLFENPDNKIIVNSNLHVESSSPLKNLNGTQTLEIKATSTPNEEKLNPDLNDAIINEAQKLFESKDYTKASNKLKEVKEILK